MKNFNKLPIVLLAGIAVGCSTTSGCPFKTSGEDCERIAIIAYMPPVVADLDYKNIQGSKNQVIVQGGFQHTLSVPEQKKSIVGSLVTEQLITPSLQSFSMPPVPENAIPETETVLFEFDQSSIAVGEMEKLDHLIQRLANVNLLHVRIEGHTDSKGTANYNKKLSVKRAKAVRDYLVRHGIAESKISSKSFDEAIPLVPNDTEAHRANNRRAELIPITGR
jgi:outer membrane protein OmpA-like peptidoglycan-associated protein